MDYRTLRQAIAIAKEQRAVEKWRTIPEFPSYVISSHGRVASKQGNILKLDPTGRVRIARGDGWRGARGVRLMFKQIWPEYPNPHAKQKKASEEAPEAP